MSANNFFQRFLILIPGMIAGIALLGGCAQEQKIEPVAVGEMQRYHDPGIGFSIEHPVGWVVNAQVGRTRMYNAQDVDKKFIDPTGVGPIGVEVSVDLVKTPDPAARIQEIKAEMVSANYQVGQESQVTSGTVSGTKLPFTANYGGSNVIHGHHVFVASDSALFDLGFSGFGGYYEAYRCFSKVWWGLCNVCQTIAWRRNIPSRRATGT